MTTAAIIVISAAALGIALTVAGVGLAPMLILYAGTLTPSGAAPILAPPNGPRTSSRGPFAVRVGLSAGFRSEYRKHT